MHAQRCDVGQDRSLITRRDNIGFSEDDYGLGGGVGRGLGVGANLGVGVGLGVELAVAVAVAVAVGVAVAVAVAVPVAVVVGVGDAVGPHAEGVAVAVGVGVGVAVGDGVPTAAAISMRPQPYTLFGGPASPHDVSEIKCAVLFKASRLAVSWCSSCECADQSSAIAPEICGVAMEVPLKFA